MYLVFIGSQLLQAHGASGMQLLGGDADFGAKAQLPPKAEPSFEAPSEAPAGFVRGRLFRRTSIITCTACRFVLLKRVRGLRSV